EDTPGAGLQGEGTGAVVQVVAAVPVGSTRTAVEDVVEPFGDAGDSGVHQPPVVVEALHAEPVALDAQRLAAFTEADRPDDDVVTHVRPQQRGEWFAVRDRGEDVRVD